MTTNLETLQQQGIIVERFSGCIKMSSLGLDLALRIGHALTVELDRLPAHTEPWFTPYLGLTLEEAQRQATENIAHNTQCIFGETRPANRNCGVRVESSSPRPYELTADIRNDYEDYPDLGGARMLHETFDAVIGALDLNT